MKSLSFHEKQHVLRLLNQQGQVKRIFDDFTRRSGLILTRWTEKSVDNVWVRNQVLEKQIDKLLEELHDNLLININNNTTDAWDGSNLKNDDLLNAYIKDLALSEIIGKSKYEEVKHGMFARNMEALKGFQQRSIDGLTLSQRVWKSVEGAKENLEYFLSSGISTGRPAAIIAQDIRQLLKDPDKRFRRVRNEEGKLILSKPMKDYHPGQGIYRSSYKNALRIAATQTNQAYHTADYERWQKLGFVIGIEVHRSRSNKGPCSICDPMVGKFPKDYKFGPNHPWCICFAVPIMLEGQEYVDYLLRGTIPESKIIKTIPQSARNYVNSSDTNKKLWFVKENSKYFEKEDRIEKRLGYVFDSKKLEERGFNLSGVDKSAYSKTVGNFNIEQLDDNLTSLSNKYGIKIRSKDLSFYFDELKLDYIGDNGFRLTRSFSNKIVYHDTFMVPEEVQGKGFAKQVLASLYEQYKNGNIKTIQVVANMDIGGYAWAKYGFKANPDRYDDLLSWAKFQAEDNIISKNDLANFEDWLINFKGNAIPMYEIASRKYGKELLKGSTWKGFIDLTDSEQVAIFEVYLNISK